MNKSKKILSVVAAATLTFSALAFSGCSDVEYKGDSLTPGYVAGVKDDVSSNGGFVVKKGGYVYFINGKEEYTADNTYGNVVKGALVRISEASLAAKKYDEVETVVPSLMVAGDYDAGIYIYGDYVYYATPTTDKNNDGEVANTHLDFKRAKLDGSEAPMGNTNDYFLRLESNTTEYRFVEQNDTVYCLFEEDGKLKSYNTATQSTTVLVVGAGTIFYNAEDPADPYVYYTMSVTYDLDKDNSTPANYNQIYRVNAAATCKVDTEHADYKVYNEKGVEVAAYNFDESFLNKKIEEQEAAEKEDKEPETSYDLSDYTTYPYVNLGELVLDGIGSAQEFPNYRVHSKDKDILAQADERFGYTYTLQKYTNDGIYFTRTAGNATTSALYYVPNEKGDTWNTIKSNGEAKVVAKDSTSTSSALLTIKEDGTHVYYYVSGSILKKVEGEKETNLAYNVSTGITLWKADDTYLYYYGSGTNGKSISRINHTGTQDEYNFLGTNEYDAITLPLVDFADDWYKPEVIELAGGKTIVMYANAQSFGTGATAYNYIYAAEMGTNEEIQANIDALEKVNEEIDSHSSNSQLQSIMKYYFRTGGLTAYENVKDLYSNTQQTAVTEFTKLFEGENALVFESEIIAQVGKTKDEDKTAIEEDWEGSFLKEEAEEEVIESLSTWEIVLIVCCCVIGFVLVVIVPAVLIKRKKAKKRREQAVLNAYKHKRIDTTDDKSIDVYADEEKAEESVIEEKTEAVAEEEKPADGE